MGPADPYSGLAADYHWLGSDTPELGSTTAGVRAEVARLPTGSRVLDAACGIGVDALALHRRGHRVTATDASPAMIARARERFAAAGASIPVAVCRWDELDGLANGPFDAVLCTGNAFAHLADEHEIARSLAGVRSVLADGGRLIVDGHDRDAIDAAGARTDGANQVRRRGATAVCTYRWRVPARPDLPYVLDIEVEVEKDGRPTVRTHAVTLHHHTPDELRAWLRSAGFLPPRIEIDSHGDRYTVVARRA